MTVYDRRIGTNKRKFVTDYVSNYSGMTKKEACFVKQYSNDRFEIDNYWNTYSQYESAFPKYITETFELCDPNKILETISARIEKQLSNIFSVCPKKYRYRTYLFNKNWRN